MSGNLAEWIIVWTFLLIVAGSMFVEAIWLSRRKSWAGFGKAFVFSALSNFIGFAVGLLVFFVVIAVFMMFSLDGTMQRVFDSSVGAVLATTALIVGFLLTPALLVICKRVFLSVLKIQTGKPAFFYALASSVVIFVVSLGVPVLTGYALFRK